MMLPVFVLSLMSYDLSIDLKASRRKAGLTQGDVAHLLGLHRSCVSALECDRREPDLEELCLLSLILGISPEQLLNAKRASAALLLERRLSTMPRPKTRWIATFNRQNTLSSLADRLDQLQKQGDGA